MACYSW